MRLENAELNPLKNKPPTPANHCRNVPAPLPLNKMVGLIRRAIDVAAYDLAERLFFVEILNLTI